MARSIARMVAAGPYHVTIIGRDETRTIKTVDELTPLALVNIGSPSLSPIQNITKAEKVLEYRYLWSRRGV